MHICSVVALAWFGWLFSLGILFWIGAVLFSLLIASQHITVFRRGLDQIDQVFFLRNGAGSLVLMVFGFFDWWVG
jgi:4-hydroxybenzoate polyprenyltransferase